MSTRTRAWLPTVLVLLFTASIAALGIWAPDRSTLLLQEDGAVEWMTVWAFVAACVMYVAGARVAEGRAARVPLVLLAVFALVVAGEEISWGQRLLTYQAPEVFLESNYQQEPNVHNLLKGIFDSRWQVTTIALGYGLVVPFATHRRWLPRSWAPGWQAASTLLLVAALELSYPFPLTGELAEVVMGFAFFQDAVFRLWRDGAGAVIRSSVGMACVALLGGVTPSVLDRVLYAPDAATTAKVQNELEVWRDHMRVSVKRRMLGKRRVHKRLFTAIKAGYLTPLTREGTHPEPRRWQYALDPWHQPYWVLHHRGRHRHGEVLLYSFGPNRRRDTRLEHIPEAMQGDDIGVRFTLPRRK